MGFNWAFKGVKFVEPSLLFNPLNAELNPICHLLALLVAHHIFHVSGLMVKYHLFVEPSSPIHTQIDLTSN
jgi:hypothetical protein